MSNKEIFLSIILLLKSIFTLAQPGAIDFSFNTSDIGYRNGDGPDGNVYACGIQSDGKIIIGGAFYSYNGTASRSIARLLSDGTIDSSFNPVIFHNSDLGVITLQIQADDKILIGGEFNSIGRSNIARLNSDGSLDSGFIAGTSHMVRTIGIQQDGKIILGGNFTNCNGISRNYSARLNSDGSLDTLFDAGLGTDAPIYASLIQADGKIVLGGDNFVSAGLRYIARFNTDGTLDSSFSSFSVVTGFVRTMKLQNDGKIVLANLYAGNLKSKVVRLMSDGSNDSTFQTGITGDNSICDLNILPNGQIIILGAFTSYRGKSYKRIARLNNDGLVDTSYIKAVKEECLYYSSSLQPDGKLIVVGGIPYNGNSRNRIARLYSDGSFDESFNQGSGADGDVYSSVIQPNGKILIGGNFDSYYGTLHRRITRLTSSGSIDSTFNPGTGLDKRVNKILLQNDGKIILGGDFTSCNELVKNYVARLLPNGLVDSIFNAGSGPNDEVKAVAIQTDGKIIIGGYFTSYDSISIKYLARLNSDGSLDSTFNTGTGPSSVIYDVVQQPDGKILIAGPFSSYNSVSSKYLLRLENDGSIDTSFHTGSGFNGSINNIKLLPDGKLIVTGGFSTYDSIVRNGIARLYTDGTLDLSFDPGAGTDGNINTISILSDQKLIIGGSFGFYNNTSINNLARINLNGTLDSSFLSGTGPAYYVNSTAIQNDGKIIIGGSFTSYNGIGRNRIARLLNDTTTNIELDEFKNRLQLQIFPNPVFGNTFRVQMQQTSGTEFLLMGVDGKIISGIRQEEIDAKEITFSIPPMLANGIYFLKITSMTESSAYKLVVSK
jgi:uncharacterized delta-60 repeat protein